MAGSTALRLCPTGFALMMMAASTVAAGEDARSGARAGTAMAPQPPRCIGSAPSDTAAAVHATNQVRAAQGLPPVRGNAVLSATAAGHACDLAHRGRLSHRGSASSGPAQRLKIRGYRPAITAENIAAGPFDLHAALDAWKGSGKHRANMLIPQLREAGIGQAVAADGRTRFWTVIYAAPR